MSGSLKYFRKKRSSGGSGVAGILKDPYWNMVGLLLRAKSAPNAKAFTDTSSNALAITQYGDTQANKFSPFSNVGYSTLFNGSSYISAADNAAWDLIASGDFTIEFWTNFQGALSNQSFLGQSNGGGPTAKWAVTFNDGYMPAGHIGVGVNGSTVVISTPFAPIASKWYHIAITRATDTWRIFIDGNLQNTVVSSTRSSPSSGVLQIGSDGELWHYFTGYLSNVRFATTALYTASFTPSTTPLTAVVNTSFLTCQSERFKDNSTNNFTLTPAGSPKIQAFSPFASTTYVPATNGGSMYFDGTGDYLQLTPTVPLELGKNLAPFTLECWVYPTISNAATAMVICGRGGGAASWSVSNGHSYNLQTNAGAYGFWHNAGGGYPFVQGGTVVLNTWTHLQVTFDGSTTRLFVNGTSVGTPDTQPTYTQPTTNNIFRIGTTASNEGPWMGYIADFRIINGTALNTSNFTPPTAPLTAVTNTKFLLSGTSLGNSFTSNATIGNNAAIVDTSNYSTPVTRVGTVTQGTFSPYATGGGSLAFDGSASYLTLDGSPMYAFGTGDFTVEAWVYRAVSGAAHNIYDSRPASTTGAYVCLFIESTNTIQLQVNGATQITGDAIPSNTWVHIALCRSGTSTKIFVNGIQSGSTFTDSTNYLNPASRPFIGISSWSSSSYIMNGYIADLRVTKGVGRYTSNFNMPTVPQTADDNTTLLLQGGRDLVSNLTGKSDVALVGDAKTSSSSQKFGSPTMYFDGTGDYVSSTSPDYALAANNFTVEFWVYPTSVANSKTMVKFGPGNPGGLAIGYYNGTGNYTIYATSNGSSWDIASDLVLVPTTQAATMLNTWTHIALTRQGSTFRGFVNGIQTLTFSNASAINMSSNALYVGSWPGVGDFAGYIEDFRFTKGVARYLTDFAVDTQVPVDPYASQTTSLVGNTSAITDVLETKTVLKVDMEGTNGSTVLIDAKGLTIAESTTVLSTTLPKYGTSSGRFSSSMNMVAGLATAMSALAGKAVTIEGWIKPDVVTSGSICVFGNIAQTANSNRLCIYINRSTTTYTVGFDWTPTTGTLATRTTTTTGTLGAWAHLAVVIDASTPAAATITVYINGTGQALSAMDFTNSTGTGPEFYIGGHYSGALPAFTGYIDEFRVTMAKRYTGNFTPAAFATLPYNPSTIIDSSSGNRLITRNGSVTQGTFSPFSSAGFSTYFNGGTSMTVADAANLYVGTGDWTFEIWINPSVNTTGLIMTKRNSSACTQFHIALTTGGAVWFGGDTGGNSWDAFQASVGVAPVNVWTHIALVRSGNNTTAYVNGIGTIVRATAWTPNTNAAPLLFGADVSGGSGAYTGYMSNARLVKGTAVYTANFTPSTVPLTAITNTSLLMHSSYSFVDKSSSNQAITLASGTPSIQALSPFTSAAYSAAVHGGSCWFNGGNTSLSVANTGGLNFTGDFTIECWVYHTPNYYAGLYLQTNDIGGQFEIRNNGNPDLLVVTPGGTSTVAPGNSWSWNHIAVVRSGTGTNNLKVYVNGVQKATQTTNAVIGSTTLPGTIGNTRAGIGGWMNGYISDFRIVNGTAVYTGAFTPPTAPLTAIANTKVLLSGTNSVIYDNLGKVNLEVSGTCKATTAVKKYGTSLAFDGTAGCYARLNTDSQQYVFGTGDFTIEMWYYPTVNSTQHSLYDGRPGANGAYPYIFRASNNTFQYLVSSTTQITSTIATVINTWYHVAVSRVNGITQLFVNGAKEGASYTDANNYLIAASCPRIGGDMSAGTLAVGYIEDLRITKGIGRYTLGFIPSTTTLGAVVKAVPSTSGGSYGPTTVEPTGGDPYYNNVVLHMHMDGLNGGTVFADQKGKAFTVTGSAKLTAATSKFGMFSITIPNGSRISTPLNTDFNFGSGDFTVECFVNYISIPDGVACSFLNNNGGPSNPGCSMGVGINVSGQFEFGYWNGSAWQGVNTGATVLSTGTWYHVAASGQNGTIRLFVDGVLSGTHTRVGAIADSSWPLVIGGNWNHPTGAYQRPFNGYLDEIRITKGVARYTANFTVPTAAFPDYQDFTQDQYLKQSVILKSATAVVPQYTTFVDSSVNNFAVTRTGDTIQTKLSPYASGGGSAYFDGTGDYLVAPSSNNFTFTADFTIECWLYVNSISQTIQRIFSSNSGPSGACYFSVGNDLGTGAGAGKLCAMGHLASPYNAGLITSPTAIPTNTWIHAALVRSGSTITLYQNGVAVATANDSATWDFNSGNAGVRISGTPWSASENFAGYINDLRVVKGTAIYTANFTPPTAPLMTVANTQLLLSMTGASRTLNTYQSNTILDSSTNNFQVTRNGNVAQGTFSPFSNSGFSTNFNGPTYGSFSTPANAGSFGFNGGVARTFESWAYITDNQSLQVVLECSPGGTGSFVIYFSAGGLKAGASNGTQTNQAIPVNQWFHWAVTINGTAITPFVNGIKGTAVTATISVANTSFTTGSRGGSYTIQGNMCHFRLYNGSAYSTDFTPPTSFTSDGYTILLLPLIKNFKDISTNNAGNPWTITVNGAPSIQAFSPFATTAYSAATNGGSMYFDGIGDYLECGLNSTLTLTGDYTVELWAYLSNVAALQVLTGWNRTAADYATINLWVNAGGALNFYSSANNTSWQIAVDTGYNVKPNEWHHYAVTKQGTTVQVFVDGVSRYSGTLSGAITNAQVTQNRIGMYSNGTQYPLVGYIADFRVVNWTALYTTSFTPPTAPLTPVTNTQLLLNGTNAAVYDSSGKVNLEMLGTAKVSTAAKKFSSSIALTNASGLADYCSIQTAIPALQLGTGDYTVEAWIYASSFANAWATNQYWIAGQWNRVGATYRFSWLINLAAGKIGYTTSADGTNTTTLTGVTTINLNQWYHVAISRVGATVKIFVDGVQDASGTAGTVYVSTQPITIGRTTDDIVTSGAWQGYIEDFRITKGVGRYVSNFTVPLAPLPV